MAQILHIIEPTLENEAGHCHSFVSSLCLAAKDASTTIWCARKARLDLPEHVKIERFFFRKLRKFQSYCLYRRLLRETGRLFISTAGRTEIVLLDLAARKKIAPKKVFLYVHYFKTSERKTSQLKKLAAKQPELVILAPTASICSAMLEAGFTQVRQVPYPITPAERPNTDCREFKQLLFAGAARSDKGFGDAVNLVGFLAAQGEKIPISLQATADHYAKFEESIQRDLARLKAIIYAPLNIRTETLTQTQYQECFHGAICLQLYSQKDFADRISGVTLDALSAGSPVIALSGTWTGRVVAEFDAGAVIDSPAPETIYNAAIGIRNRFAYYHDNALKAGATLQTRHSAGHLFRELTA